MKLKHHFSILILILFLLCSFQSIAQEKKPKVEEEYMTISSNFHGGNEANIIIVEHKKEPRIIQFDKFKDLAEHAKYTIKMNDLINEYTRKGWNLKFALGSGDDLWGYREYIFVRPLKRKPPKGPKTESKNESNKESN